MCFEKIHFNHEVKKKQNLISSHKQFLSNWLLKTVKSPKMTGEEKNSSYESLVLISPDDVKNCLRIFSMAINICKVIT